MDSNSCKRRCSHRYDAFVALCNSVQNLADCPMALTKVRFVGEPRASSEKGQIYFASR
jgi:hypothetical protein